MSATHAASSTSYPGRRRPVWAVSATGVAAGLIGWSEWKTWSASRELLPESAWPEDAGVTVLVLGCPLPVLQRWRVRIAVRSTDPRRARFVFSGGAVRTTLPEAQMMADYAIAVLGVPRGNVVIEDQSRTTVENVTNSAKLLTDETAIMVMSNTFHARRARQVVHDETPDLARRLIRARDYRLLEWGPLHLILLALESSRQRSFRKRSRMTESDNSASVPVRCTEPRCGAVTLITAAEFHPARRETVLASRGWNVRWGVETAYECPRHRLHSVQ